MIRRIAAVLCAAFIALGLAGCAARSGVLRDGYYSAAMEDYDEHGWQEYMVVFISGGTIASAEYNARNRSGYLKSWDMKYMSEMNAACGTYPNQYTRDYAAQMLLWQDLDAVEALSGATRSYQNFLALADAALARARAGDATVARVEEPDHGDE